MLVSVFLAVMVIDQGSVTIRPQLNAFFQNGYLSHSYLFIAIERDPWGKPSRKSVSHHRDIKTDIATRHVCFYS